VTITTVANVGGAPMSGIRVQVNDDPEQLTDAEGNAFFARAARPYSVRVVERQGETGNNHNVWQLVDRVDDHLVFPVLGAPVDGATFTPDTTFRWTAAADAASYAVQMTCEQPGTFIDFRMLETRDTELRFPSIEGIDLSAGASCRWRVHHLQGAAYEYGTWTLPAFFARASTLERFLTSP
jgi:hypothetical protein